ncbi:MAG: metallophosphoesterase [Spirochaetes bacterium]|nr:metallophosphoesterase [Spirochaetota bacterium]
MSENKIQSLKDRLIYIYKRKDPPKLNNYLSILKKINNLLINENEDVRPLNENRISGGLIYLKQHIPTIIVPDIHARMDFFLNVMLYKDEDGITNLQKLAEHEVQIVCVGDGFHAESRAIERWKHAYEEYIDKYKKHKHIDQEMKESMSVMEMVMETKINFPDNFHFLKGNHENITNERGNGNYPFRKFAYEGPMVLYYVEEFYGNEFLSEYHNFERNLPVFAVGKNFLVSHAEPKTFYKKENIIEYRKHPEVIEGLTWTNDDMAEDNSVTRMLEHYIENNIEGKNYHFGGHRPVKKLYNKRANGKYIQIHNPAKFIIAIIMHNKDIDLDNDIIELKDNTREIIKHLNI